MTDDGVFITSEKFNPESAKDKNWSNNESQKYDHQSKYFNEDDLKKDKEEIIT